MYFRILVLLSALSFFTNCAGTKDGKPAPPNDTVSGTVTIDGKPENLSHVYARRRVAYLSPTREYFVLVFTNKPVQEGEMSELLEHFAGNESETDFLKDKSVIGVIFIVEKMSSDFYRGYEGQVVYDGRSYFSRHSFDELSMQKGRMRGKTSRTDVEGGPIEVTPDKGKPFTFKYAVEFEVTPQGVPVNKEWEGAVSPELPHLLSEQGTAEGALTVDGKTMNLKYAYALRKRKFFDEPEEMITVLATDMPYAQDVLLKILNGLKTKETIQGLLLTTYTERYTERDKSVFVDIFQRTFDRGVLNTTSRIENLSIGRDRFTATKATSGTEGSHNWNYSVSVDVPFKR